MPDAGSTVTVVIPCFDQAKYLPAAIASVRRQSYPNVAVLVVDDGSRDDTAVVAARLGATVIRQGNRGVSEARNSGLAHAASEFVIFLDADDELLDHAAARGVNALRGCALAACAVGRCVPIDDHGRVLPSMPTIVDASDLYRSWLLHNFVWAPAAATFRRRALESIGGFPPRLGPAADYAVYLTFARERRVVDHGWEVARYRQHEASMSRNAGLMLRTTLEVLRRERQLMPAQYLADLARGKRVWRDWYGEQMVERLRRDWRAGEVGAAQLRAFATLVRFCPRTVLRHARRKARRTLFNRSEHSLSPPGETA